MRLAQGTPGFLVAVWTLPFAVSRGWLRVATAGVAAGCTWFFRDPDRIAGGEGLLAAADGVVQWVQVGHDGRATVSTYLNLLDVHVTRAPCDATVVKQTYHPGRHRRAFRSDAHENERMEWVLATEHGPVRLTQFAGTLARRIVNHRSTGDTVRRGERIGLIRFGSRVDVELPAGLSATVDKGQRMRGGTTVVARPGP